MVGGYLPLQDLYRDRHPIIVIQKAAQVGISEFLINTALWAAGRPADGTEPRGKSASLAPPPRLPPRTLTTHALSRTIDLLADHEADSRMDMDQHRFDEILSAPEGLGQSSNTKLSDLERAGIDIDSAGIDDEDRHFLLALRTHPDIRNVTAELMESPPSYGGERFEGEEEGNPILHITVHAMVKGAVQEDLDFKPALDSLVKQAQAYQSNAEASHHAAEHALGMLLIDCIWRTSSGNSKAALRKLHDVLRRCAKWKRVPAAVVEHVRTPISHPF